MPRITNDNAFRAWLDTQPREVCVFVAARAAMRVFSFVTDQSRFGGNADHYKTQAQLAVLTAHAILISGVAALASTPEIPARTAAAAASRADTAASHIRADVDTATFSAAAAASDAAFSAAFATDTASAASAAFSAFSAARAAFPYADAYADCDIPFEQLLNRPLWGDEKEPDWPRPASQNLLTTDPHWSFWRDWYQGFLKGKPLDWELQRRVALIPDEDWEKGPEHIARKIEDIRREFEAEQPQQPTLLNEKPVSAEAAKAMAQKLKTNRDAIALTSASALEQIAEFREMVRGNNQLDPEFRERLLGFLDELAAKLQNLHNLLPSGSETPDEETGEQGVRWLRAFKASFFKEAAEYTSPGNVAKSIIPTGIILTCTGVGTLMGMPVAGTVVGGLITGQIKPGKAADDLLKPRTPAPE
ncbi:hypothetical protein K3X44_11455 [Aliiroseovarius crassostreae]|uniref:hypothetical protein n=1 Tax=Aliiroseovarius crassostreae TaxID=154981 RepID=UPI00220C6FD6|nr:hypothetical protein [Aliiroseovarius crassostreae]UWQ01106.1 hypothetical protein K3X44_11455 [Aliiroseovarius crassostreae]